MQLWLLTIVPLNAQEVSLDEKPVPVTETVVPTCADVGLKVMDAMPLVVPRVSVAEAESSSGVPVAVMVYVLTATSATVNEPVNVPSEIEHVCDVTGVPVSEQDVSAVLKPDPDTSTTPPGSAEEALNVICAPLPPAAAIVKLVAAESPPGLPTAVIVYVPVLAAATVNVPVNVPPETEQV